MGGTLTSLRRETAPRGILTLGAAHCFRPLFGSGRPAARPSVSLTLPFRRRSLPNGPDQGSQNFHSAGPPPFSVALKIPSQEGLAGTNTRRFPYSSSKSSAFD